VIALRPTADPHRFALDVTPALSVGAPEAQFLFGGAGLAASVAALEAAVARPVVWAAAQYLSYARPPATLDLDVVVPVLGKHNAQARCTGHVGDTEILTVNAALGSRPAEVSMQWPIAPPAPPPDDCPPMTYRRERLYPSLESSAKVCSTPPLPRSRTACPRPGPPAGSPRASVRR